MPIKLMVGGVIMAVVGWGITYWEQSREEDALDALLEPLGDVLRYGGIIILIAGLLWLLYLRAQRT
jgi:hypothetical protein